MAPGNLADTPEGNRHGKPKSCDPVEAMKILFGILAVLVVAASLFADYKWRQWMVNHPTNEDLSAGTPPARRRDRQ